MFKKKKKPAEIDKFAAQKRYASNQTETGMIRVSMWIPEDDKEKALKFGRELRAGVK